MFIIKKKLNQYYVYKIRSSRLKSNNWNLNLSPEEARCNREVVKLAESQVIRFINQITHNSFTYEDTQKINREIKTISRLPDTQINRTRIKQLRNLLDEKLFLQDYIMVIMDSMKDYDVVSKSFVFNGLRFYRLFATAGGAKKGVVVFASERVYEQLKAKLNNGRDQTKQLVPAKFEAYKSLVSSASIPVSLIHPKSVAVIEDYRHKIYKDVTLISNDEELSIKEIKNFELELNINDGYGFISYRLAEHWRKELGLDYVPSGFCIRFGFTKGMLFVFDYHLFAEEEAKTNVYTDVWGNSHSDLNDIDMVLTASMAKLWSSYSDINQFMECNWKNGYTFSITKVMPQKLENERNLTYQFIQSLELSDEDIDNLTKPTVNFIKDAMGGDWRKSLLFLKGIHLTDKSVDDLEYDFAHALMLEPKMIDDPFVAGNIKKMIRKMINDAKLGRLRVNGNYQTIGGDPYALSQHMFNMPVTGLLGEGEFYSDYWNERNVERIAGFRAPMSCHENIRILKLNNDKKLKKWYKYLDTVIIFNAWDATTHALNGADFDGDQLMTTNNPIILHSIVESNAIICEQGTAIPKIIEEIDLIRANKQSKGDDIGVITNKATAMYDMLSFFSKDSQQYKELSQRIKRCQKLQQDSIDRAKGIEGQKMPKVWYDANANIVRDFDSKEILSKDEFNLSIVTDKNPYFMIYSNDEMKKKHDTYMKNSNKSAMNRFGIELFELLAKVNRTEEEESFVHYYNQMNPCTHGESTMNKICKKIENEFKRSRTNNQPFDYSILKSDATYEKPVFDEMKKLYDEYVFAVAVYEQALEHAAGEENGRTSQRDVLKDRFRFLALNICSNEDVLCNIVIDMLYSNNNSKQFVWDIAGDTIIRNLRKRSNYMITYLELDMQGDVEFAGERFSVKRKRVKEGDIE
ncbi:hypothetical protein [Paenibacillus sp. NPDC058174]|uniref:RNA dependent RNA polymerase n=1 Tax=Paenibacillus sp. NPDC058174 TaxID=3346366 RepID=UPI0036DFA047